MTRKKKSKDKGQEAFSGAQGTLIDVSPKQSKELIEKGHAYKKAVKQRLLILAEEKNLKAEILEIIKRENLTPVDGKIKFEVDGMMFTVTPRDELLQIKEADEIEEE